MKPEGRVMQIYEQLRAYYGVLAMYDKLFGCNIYDKAAAAKGQVSTKLRLRP